MCVGDVRMRAKRCEAYVSVPCILQVSVLACPECV